jgi:hypothetical protein
MFLGTLKDSSLGEEYKTSKSKWHFMSERSEEGPAPRGGDVKEKNRKR